MHRTTYRPGAWNVLVTEHIVVALPEGTDVSLLSALWDGSDRCRDLTVLIEMLTEAVGGSLSALPAFGAVILDDGAVRVAVRGTVSVTVDVDGEPMALTGAAASTWSEHLLQGATRVHLRAEETAQPELPLIGGVVRAGELTIVTHETAVATDAAPAVASEPEVVTDALPVTEAMPVADPPLPQPQATAQATAQEPDPAPADLPVPPTFFPSMGGVPAAVLASPVEDIVRTIIPEREPEPEHEPAPEPEPEPEAEMSDIDEFEMLWAETVHRAPRGGEAPTEPMSTGSAASDAESGEAALGDHDGATISAAQARDLRRPAVDQEASTMVLPVVGQGRLRMSTGQVITLDRTVIIGRRPRATRASGDTLPRLVAVESPQQDISRNHLEVRPEADTVVIVDLHTTNGTTLLRHGAEPLRLHPGEPTLVIDGDTVDLGDGVTLVFEGLA